MKITKYFASSHKDHFHLNLAIEEAEKKRNTFLADNNNSIGEIEKEDIKFVASQNNNYVHAIIILTYFPK